MRFGERFPCDALGEVAAKVDEHSTDLSQLLRRRLLVAHSVVPLVLSGRPDPDLAQSALNTLERRYREVFRGRKRYAHPPALEEPSHPRLCQSNGDAGTVRRPLDTRSAFDACVERVSH